LNPLLLTLLTFLAAALAVAAVYSLVSDLFLRDRSRLTKRVDDQFRKQQRERVKESSLFKNLSAPAPGAEGPDQEEKLTLRQWFGVLLEQSGLTITPQRLWLYTAAGGLLFAALVCLFRPAPFLVILGLATPLGASLPLLYVLFKRMRRLSKLTSQLPDAFDLMARVIRAGQTMSQALQAVADEFDAPLAGEFAYCFEQQNLGLPPDLALRDLARRTGLLEIKIFVLALLVQQQTGGNLAELLDKLAGVIRERFKVRGKVRALTAEGRLQAIVLLALPPGMFLIILALNRHYAQSLLDHPGLLVGVLVAEALGALWIRKIVNFEF
jgi:tight adherence protein B